MLDVLVMRPIRSSDFGYRLAQARENANAVMLFGLNTVAVPLDVIGAVGCSLLAAAITLAPISRPPSVVSSVSGAAMPPAIQSRMHDLPRGRLIAALMSDSNHGTETPESIPMEESRNQSVYLQGLISTGSDIFDVDLTV